MDSDTKQSHRGLALGCNDFHRICLAYDTAGYFKDSQLPFNGALMVLNSGYLGGTMEGSWGVLPHKALWNFGFQGWVCSRVVLERREGVWMNSGMYNNNNR